MKRKNLSFLALFFCSVFTVYLYGQQQVSGVVSSDDGELLPGVSVVVKGTTTGVSSDFDGNYSINVPNAQSTLVFSYLGMETQEVVVGGRSTINVTMATSSEALDEVVVTALGISREKKSLGYAVSEVDGDALDNVPQENALNALSGKVSGVSINSTGGPGSSVNMVIRGANSLTGDNQPLFVIDGTPIFNTLNNVSGFGDRNTVDFGNPISDINPDDIENISILKGASAAALYGSRAGNGVVLITTKSGKAKKGLGVTVTSNAVFDIPFRYINSHRRFAAGNRPYTEDNFPSNAFGTLLINEGASAWAGPELDRGINAIQWPYTQQEVESGIPVARELRSYNNPANFFQTAITTTQNISIENSSENLSYRLSVNNMDNVGFIPNTDLKRTGVSLNSSVKLNEKIRVSSNLNYVKNGSNNRPGGDRGVNPIHALYQLAPHIDVRLMEDYWLDGFEGLRQHAPYTFSQDLDPTDISQNNPYFLAYEALNSFERNRTYGNIKVDWELLPGLTLMGRYAYDGYNEERETKIS
ncbi:MAG: SusC/RagA family TonB-linked outer membrane protein, partial [Bacteroidota bacterium]